MSTAYIKSDQVRFYTWASHAITLGNFTGLNSQAQEYVHAFLKSLKAQYKQIERIFPDDSEPQVFGKPDTGGPPGPLQTYVIHYLEQKEIPVQKKSGKESGPGANTSTLPLFNQDWQTSNKDLGNSPAATDEIEMPAKYIHICQELRKQENAIKERCQGLEKELRHLRTQQGQIANKRRRLYLIATLGEGARAVRFFDEYKDIYNDTHDEAV